MHAAIRRSLLLLISATVLSLAVLAMPSESRAAVGQHYKGWAYVNASGCRPQAPCPRIRYHETTAWHWTGYQWNARRLNDDTLIYAWPYAQGWHWAWTNETGWLALPSYKITYTR
jgi:hypothetical protein